VPSRVLPDSVQRCVVAEPSLQHRRDATRCGVAAVQRQAGTDSGSERNHQHRSVLRELPGGELLGSWPAWRSWADRSCLRLYFHAPGVGPDQYCRLPGRRIGLQSEYRFLQPRSCPAVLQRLENSGRSAECRFGLVSGAPGNFRRQRAHTRVHPYRRCNGGRGQQLGEHQLGTVVTGSSDQRKQSGRRDIPQRLLSGGGFTGDQLHH